MSRCAVVLFNLGGPDNLAAVYPFLRNLFSDPAIISVPQPFRWVLSRVIASRRAPTARHIYRQMGGYSPILDWTRAQARALEERLQQTCPAEHWKVVIAMRYWHPFADEAARVLAAFSPDSIVLLPLYPQYSRTTTGSSLDNWVRAARSEGVSAPETLVCCYPDDEGFIAAQTHLAEKMLAEARGIVGEQAPIRLLFSAHGLPKRVIEAGDPYQWQVEQTVAAIVALLRERGAMTERVEPITCYQSKVGPLEWIGPATDAEVRRAGADGAGIVVVPLAFVSEHSETLVELDLEYRELAEESGAACYLRVRTVGTDPLFIAGLGRLVVEGLGAEGRSVRSGAGRGARICPSACGLCPREAV